jgi:hypothetical protein
MEGMDQLRLAMVGSIDIINEWFELQAHYKFVSADLNRSSIGRSSTVGLVAWTAYKSIIMYSMDYILKQAILNELVQKSINE